MTSLNDALLTAAGLLGLGAAAPARAGLDVQAFLPQTLTDESLSRIAEGRSLPPDEAEADDPFFLAVADALREAGYLDS
ncbi:MAG: hypothetical protein PGN25_11905 [Methylorubrum populi]